jgi:hypothetical protein
MTNVRPMSTKTWNEIYELVGGIQHKAIEIRDWQVAKDADVAKHSKTHEEGVETG